jgi:Divergent InlB B-repeat domain
MTSRRTLLIAALISIALAVLRGADAADTHAWSIESVTRDSVGHRSRAAVAARELPRTGSTWCGTASQVDVTPNAVAGYATHWIYAVPSDGADAFATYANAMQADAESIDAWWRSQDGARVPRNDLARMSCGLQLDLTQIRLPHSSAVLADDDIRFMAIAQSLGTFRFADPHAKYVVYYDGPGDPDICGEGGSHMSGYGYAIVYVQACAGVPPNTTATHELLHTLGAVPSGAPNECPYPNDGHVCDDAYDMMFPFGDETPITGLHLDTGRDDYYAHAGAQLDVQDSPWLVQLDRQVPLALSISGTGSVTGDLPGLRCNQSCTTTWNADTALLLEAEPAAGSKLVRWGAGCTGASECSVRLSQATNVSVVFAPLNVRLKVAVSGRGTVRGPHTGIACPVRCAADVPSYEPLRLTAKPMKGWRFKGWSGSCRGRTVVCTLPMTANSSARAIFVRSS